MQKDWYRGALRFDTQGRKRIRLCRFDDNSFWVSDVPNLVLDTIGVHPDDTTIGDADDEEEGDGDQEEGGMIDSAPVRRKPVAKKAAMKVVKVTKTDVKSSKKKLEYSRVYHTKLREWKNAGILLDDVLKRRAHKLAREASAACEYMLTWIKYIYIYIYI